LDVDWPITGEDRRKKERMMS